MKPKVGLIIVFVLSISLDVALAQIKAPPAPVFPTTAPTLSKVVVENEYQFSARQYSPPVEVQVVRRDSASYDAPESAAIAGISAMAAGDFDWFRSTWDEASRAVLETRDRQMKQDPAFWVKTWKGAFTDRRIELTARIDTGEYVLIAYRLVPRNAAPAAPNGNAPVELVVVLKSDNGKWMATQELAADPVLAYWKTPDVKPRRVIRTALPVK
jgi:hypothetical protein